VEAELNANGFGRSYALALVCVAGLAQAETRPRYAGTIEATLLGGPATLDPVAARTHAEITAVGLVFDTLYRLDADGVAQPHLAVAAPVYDERRTTARITIVKGARFHDGSELTVLDVAASLERARVQARWALASIAEVHVDGDAVELALRAPVAELTTLLALPQTSVTKGGKPPGDRPVGSGPYAVEAWDRSGHRLALRPFDDHFAGRPYAELVLRWYDTSDDEARKFETGAAQLSARGAAAFAGGQPTYRAEVLTVPAWVLVFVGFGKAHAQLTNDRAFRRALDLAIARGGLATVNSGEDVQPVREPVPISAGGSALPAADRGGDLAGARAQLQVAAGRVPALAAGGGHPLTLEVLVEDTRPDDREIAERVVRALDLLGIAASVTALPSPQLRERVVKGQCDLWIGQLAGPVGSALAWWGAAFAAGSDDWPLAQLATGTIDPAAANKAFSDRLPVVPLMFRGLKLWRREDVRGLAYDGFGRPGFADLFYFGTPRRAKP
jgi:ABC-type transport system substrate-binding protein